MLNPSLHSSVNINYSPDCQLHGTLLVGTVHGNPPVADRLSSLGWAHALKLWNEIEWGPGAGESIQKSGCRSHHSKGVVGLPAILKHESKGTVVGVAHGWVAGGRLCDCNVDVDDV